MNTTASELNLRDLFAQIVPNVFDTMLALPVTPAPAGRESPLENRISGTVGVGGETVTGAVYVHLPGALALRAVQILSGAPPGQPASHAEVNDVVGELANMIAGGFKSALCNAERPCAMSTPSIIRGDYAVEGPHELKAEVFHFHCQGGQGLAVEVHLKLD
jgi:chemotaxis protein CheX